MIAKLLTAALMLVFVTAGIAGADILWDQSGFDPFGPGFFNSESGSPPFGMTNHAVNHVTVGGGGWTITAIHTYYSALDPAFGDGVAQGYLHVWPKTGPLPTHDPTVSPLIAMSGALNVDHIVMTAAGLNIPLAPGEYWIGITPIAAAGPFGPEIHLSSTAPYGDATASYDPFAFPGPPAWFNFNPGMDASILIEGTRNGSTANDETTWGDVKALFK